jgi:hypothetical protein
MSLREQLEAVRQRHGKLTRFTIGSSGMTPSPARHTVASKPTS